MGHFVQLRAADGFDSQAYVAQPKTEPRGAIVVLPEIFGVNSHIRTIADGFACCRFFGDCPRHVFKGEKDVDLGYTASDVEVGRALKNLAEGLPSPGVMADVQAAISHASLATKGKVGVVGYCWGGLLSWRAATQFANVESSGDLLRRRHDLGARALQKTSVPNDVALWRQRRFDSYQHRGNFQKTQPAVDVHVYDADHGFNCDQRGSYNAAAADLALERTLGFSIKHLEGG
jgi:carboxymethylenebutenolidase